VAWLRGRVERCVVVMKKNESGVRGVGDFIGVGCLGGGE
jgi:hypothetical protein